MKQAGYLTISVDDGHPQDLRAAELLARYGIAATFYIPANNSERPMMKEGEIKNVSTSFEVGAHTYNHRPLRGIPGEDVYKELIDGKDWLEQLVGQQVTSFCYPKGKFDRQTVRAVREVGFRGARTCMHNLSAFPDNPYLWGLSTQAFSHSQRVHVQHALVEGNFRGLINFYKIHHKAVDWADHFKRAVQHVNTHGGIAHLYFHSWEIDEQGHWQKLEDLLKFTVDNSSLEFRTNGELFELWHSHHMGSVQ